jgi:hypothetical protein
VDGNDLNIEPEIGLYRYASKLLAILYWKSSVTHQLLKSTNNIYRVLALNCALSNLYLFAMIQTWFASRANFCVQLQRHNSLFKQIGIVLRPGVKIWRVA